VSQWFIFFFIVVLVQIIAKIEQFRGEREQIRFIGSVSSIDFKNNEDSEKYNMLVKKYFGSNTIPPSEESETK